jgi:hypothetical protein
MYCTHKPGEKFFKDGLCYFVVLHLFCSFLYRVITSWDHNDKIFNLGHITEVGFCEFWYLLAKPRGFPVYSRGTNLILVFVPVVNW